MKHRRKYYITNRKRYRSVRKKYRDTNAGKLAEYAREYRKANPEKWRKRNRRRRAMKRSVSENFTDEEACFVRSFWGNRCAVCGRTQEEEKRAMPIDHWHPLSKGNPLTMKNAVLLCQKHNSQKGPSEPEDIFGSEIVKYIEGRIEVQIRMWNEHENMAH